MEPSCNVINKWCDYYACHAPCAYAKPVEYFSLVTEYGNVRSKPVRYVSAGWRGFEVNLIRKCQEECLRLRGTTVKYKLLTLLLDYLPYILKKGQQPHHQHKSFIKQSFKCILYIQIIQIIIITICFPLLLSLLPLYFENGDKG